MNYEEKIHTVRVFVNEKGEYGNPVGIILDEKRKVNSDERRKIAKKLGFSETVFINDLISRNISIYNPQQEILFSGYAMLGTAWYINKLQNNQSANYLVCQGEKTMVWQENDLVWIRAKISILPHWNYRQLKTADEVKDLPLANTSSYKHAVVWGWMDKEEGLVRARTFAPDWGIEEDEANGSGSMLLASKLARDLTIFHGKGSMIFAKPDKLSFAEVGGRVSQDKKSDFSIFFHRGLLHLLRYKVLNYL